MIDNAAGEQKIQLDAIDPDRDENSEERFVNAVMSSIELIGPVYPVSGDPLIGMWLLARPALIAASVIMAVAGVALLRSKPTSAGDPVTVAEAVGIPMEYRAVTTEQNNRSEQ